MLETVFGLDRDAAEAFGEGSCALDALELASCIQPECGAHSWQGERDVSPESQGRCKIISHERALLFDQLLLRNVSTIRFMYRLIVVFPLRP